LKRAIQRLILDPMAMDLISGNINENSNVTIDSSEGKLKIESEQKVSE
jgi:ATP-dependent Clp protease ATP-binding subunit ClpA